jgi:hypothetical protein
MSLEKSFYYKSKVSDHYLAINMTSDDIAEIESGSAASGHSSFTIPLSLLTEVIASIQSNDNLNELADALFPDPEIKANLLMCFQKL